MNKIKSFLLLLISLGLFLFASCNYEPENQGGGEKVIPNAEAEELFGSFIKEDSLPFSFSSEHLSYNYWRGIDYPSIINFIDPSLREYNNGMQNIIDSLNLINEKSEIYEPQGTQYDEKYWDDEDLDYIFNGHVYNGVRYFQVSMDKVLLLYMKIDTDEYTHSIESIESPLILATHQASNGERIDSIQIDYHQLIESLEVGTGHLIIKESGVLMKYGEVDKNVKIDNDGNFVKK